MNAIEILLDVLLVAVSAAAAFFDVWKKKIYLWITLPALGLGLVLNFIGFGIGEVFGQGLVSSLAGVMFGTVVFGMFFLWKRRMGGGDVLLVAAVGAVAGFNQTLVCMMLSTLVGAVLGILLLVLNRFRKINHPALRRLVFTRKKGSEKEVLTVPYAAAIFLGVLWTLFYR
jgi:Flp pilus assembly protein protease CpaA